MGTREDASDMMQFPRHVQDLPEEIRPIFKSFSDHNLLVSAPTGSGKTVVMELAICRMIQNHELNVAPHSAVSASAPAFSQSKPKTIFIAPTKSLVQEKAVDWSERFGTASLGMTTAEVSGDTEVESSAVCNDSDIICTTAEKLDSLTRNQLHKGGATFFGEVGLLLIDEVHLLAENRGGTLEAVISRIMMLSATDQMHDLPISALRIVAVSATIPNAVDIAQWLHVPPQGLKVYGEEMRPVKLNTLVKAYQRPKTDFLLERRLNEYLPAVLHDHAEGRPALVFCSSRKGTTETANHLASLTTARGGTACYIWSTEQTQQLDNAANSTSNKVLQAAIRVGVGFHHAGMDQSDRAMVEQLFRSRSLQVLCTTSTLALGVNLPAFLVVIKGTRLYVGAEAGGSGYREYDRSSCLQMVGRAGRPQFDSEGVAVIMTTTDHAHRYRDLVSGCERIDSTLHTAMVEHLNAEVCLRTIKDMATATSWLRHTFLYICALQQPAKYGIAPHSQGSNSWSDFDSAATTKFVVSHAKKLAQHGLVESDDQLCRLRSTRLGELMSLYGVRFKTMVVILEVPPHAAIPDLLSCISKCQELSQIRLRRGEKSALNALNKGGEVKFPLFDPNKPGKKLDRVKTSDQKLYLLLLAALADTDVFGKLDYSMRQEAEEALRVGRRVATCMEGVYTHLKAFAAAGNAARLSRSLQLRIWDDTAHQCRQMPAVGLKSSEKLCSAGLGKLSALCDADPRRIERVSMRAYPFGNQLQQEIRNRLPPLVTMKISGTRVPNRSGTVQIHVTLSRTAACSNARKCRGVLLVGTPHNDQLLLAESLHLDCFQSPLTLKCIASTRPMTDGKAPASSPARVVAYLMARDVIADDRVETFPLQSACPGPASTRPDSAGQTCQLFNPSRSNVAGVWTSSVRDLDAKEPQQDEQDPHQLTSGVAAHYAPSHGDAEVPLGGKRARSPPPSNSSAPLKHMDSSQSLRTVPLSTNIPSGTMPLRALISTNFSPEDHTPLLSRQPALSLSRQPSGPSADSPQLSLSRQPTGPPPAPVGSSSIPKSPHLSNFASKRENAPSVAASAVESWQSSGRSGSQQAVPFLPPLAAPSSRQIGQGCAFLQNVPPAKSTSAHFPGMIAASSSQVAFEKGDIFPSDNSFAVASPVHHIQTRIRRTCQPGTVNTPVGATRSAYRSPSSAPSYPGNTAAVPDWMRSALDQTDPSRSYISNSFNQLLPPAVKNAWEGPPRARIQVESAHAPAGLPLLKGVSAPECAEHLDIDQPDIMQSPREPLKSIHPASVNRSPASVSALSPFSQFSCTTSMPAISTPRAARQQPHTPSGARGDVVSFYTAAGSGHECPLAEEGAGQAIPCSRAPHFSPALIYLPSSAMCAGPGEGFSKAAMGLGSTYSPPAPRRAASTGPAAALSSHQVRAMNGSISVEQAARNRSEGFWRRP